MKFQVYFPICLLLVILCLIPHAKTLGNQCGIKFCTSCDPKTKSCYECDLPYKPGFANQSICTRCANNCAVCEKQGSDSKGRCLSCQANYDYSLDNKCDTFYIWIYVVVIAFYVIFVITLFIVFCLMKRRRDKKQAFWFQNLKIHMNKVDTDRFSIPEFQKMCESLVQLIQESSSYNNLKFKDREFEKAMKIKELKIKPIKTETHLKKIKFSGSDNSQWEAHGFIFIPQDRDSKLKLWFAKNYKRKVSSESISKIIIYESQRIGTNEIKGKWYYFGSPEIGGNWSGVRHQIQEYIASNEVNINS